MADNNQFPPIDSSGYKDVVQDAQGLLRRLKESQASRDLERGNQARFGIPGKAYWNGYSARGKPTVKLPNGLVIEVIKTFNTSLQLGAVVYVDERRVISGRSVSKKAPKKVSQDTLRRKRRGATKKNTVILPPPLPVDRTVGRTWLVYTENYEPLHPMTEGYGGMAPFDETFQSLVGEFVATGGLGFSASLNLAGLGLLDYPEWQIGTYSYLNTDGIFPPENNPDLPEGHTGEEYAFFCLISGFLQRFYEGIGFGPEDGVIVGSGSTANLLYAIFSGDWHWARIYMFGGNTSKYTDQVIGGIQHYSNPGDLKASFAFSRTVGVYPAKRFYINVTSWNQYQGAGIELGLIDDPSELPEPRTSSRFVIPDDITEWEYDYDYVYEVIPAHKPIEHFQDGNTMPSDITKFAAYSGNDLYLNYIIKCYTIFGADDSLSIYYYPLNLRVKGDGSFEYKLGEPTFNLPRHDLIREDPAFPIQAGQNTGKKYYLQARFTGIEDVATVSINHEAFGYIGGPIISGQIDIGDLDERDRPYVQLFFGNQDNFTWNPPNEGAPFALKWDSFTGYWEFDPNEYEGYVEPDEIAVFIIPYIASPIGRQDPFSSQNEEGPYLTITVYGSSYYQGGGPSSSIPIPPQPAPVYLPLIQPSLTGSDGFVVEYQDIPRQWLSPPAETAMDPISFEPFEVIIPLEEEYMEITYQGVGGDTVNALNYPEVLSRPIVYVGDRFYHYESDISGLLPDVLPELLVNEEGKYYAFRLVYEPLPTSIMFLDANEVLTVTYEFKYSFNYAPYVGNYENLGAYQQRSLRRAFAKNAFDNDWRKLLNATVYNEETEEYEEIDDTDIPVRDTNILPFNYDPVHGTMSGNFGYEFDIREPSLYNNYSEINSQFQAAFVISLLFYNKDGSGDTVVFDGIETRFQLRDELGNVNVVFSAVNESSDISIYKNGQQLTPAFYAGEEIELAPNEYYIDFNPAGGWDVILGTPPVVEDVISGAVNELASLLNFQEAIYPEYNDIPEDLSINDPGGFNLRFYFTGDFEKTRPLTLELARDVLFGRISEVDPINKPGQYFLQSDINRAYGFNAADAFLIQDLITQANIQASFDPRMLPRRINMNDSSGKSWRYEVKNSVVDKGYIFTAYNKEPTIGERLGGDSIIPSSPTYQGTESPEFLAPRLSS